MLSSGDRAGRLRRELGRFDRRVWLLFGAMLAFRFGQGLYYPFSTIYFHNVVGIPLSLVGVGLAALSAAAVVSGFVSGPLADRYGRKPLMVVALSGSAFTFGAFAFVQGFYGYLLVSIVAGLAGHGMFDAARNAMVADVTEAHLRARAYGIIRVGANVGWALGPAVAGLVAAAYDTGGVYRALFLATGGLMAVVLVSLALLVRESLPAPEDAATMRAAPAAGLRAALADWPFVLFLGCCVLLYYVFTQNWQALPVYSKNFLGLPDWQIGLFLSGNGVMVILLQLPIALALDRHRSKVASLIVAAALFAASSVTLLLTESFWGVLLAFAGFFTLAEMVLEVAGAAAAADLAPAKWRGTYMALFGTCWGVAYGVSPIVSGVLLDAALPALIWWLQLGAVSLAALGLALLARKERRGCGAGTPGGGGAEGV
ncbi:MFS transporter, partial [Rubrobacter taiwanensis]|uniref:MFS transporter n=1 Tax=Rubrobacter taiwanensis TaxID=185139 RepID=UPI001404E30A